MADSSATSATTEAALAETESREAQTTIENGSINASDEAEILSSPTEIDARRARQLLERSATLSERGDQSGAMLACRQAVALAPTSPSAHSHLAHLLERAGNTPDAIAAYEKVMALSPESASERESLRRLRDLSKKRAASPVFRFDDSELFDDTAAADITANNAASGDDGAISKAATSAASQSAPVAAAAVLAPNAVASTSVSDPLPTIVVAPVSTTAAPIETGAASTHAPYIEPAPHGAAIAAVATPEAVPVAPHAAVVVPSPAPRAAAPVVVPAATALPNVATAANHTHSSLPAASHVVVGPIAPLDFGDAPVAPQGRLAALQGSRGRNSFYVRSVPLVITSGLGLVFMLWARNSALSRVDASRTQNVVSTTIVDSPVESAMPAGASSQIPAATTDGAGASSTSDGNVVPPPASGTTAVASSASTGSGTNAGGASAVAPNPAGATGATRTAASARPSRSATVARATSEGNTPAAASSAPAPTPNPFAGLSSARNLPPPQTAAVPAIPDARISPDNGGSTSGGGPLNPGATRRGATRVITGPLQPAIAPPRADNRARSAEEAARDAAARGQTGRAVSQTTTSINAGGADVAFRLQQRALLYVDQGDNARAIDDFRSAIAAYNDLIGRGVRVAEARRGLAACQSGLRLAQANLNRR